MRRLYLRFMKMTGPIENQCAEDRFPSCEEDLEADFQALVFKAMQAGWDEGEACAAIASLADHHLLALHANRRTGFSIRKLKP